MPPPRSRPSLLHRSGGSQGYSRRPDVAVMRLLQSMASIERKRRAERDKQRNAALSFARQAPRTEEVVVMNGEKTCPVCMEKFKNITTTACGHCFCWDCIRDSMKYSPHCPQCRTEVRGNELIRLFLWSFHYSFALVFGTIFCGRSCLPSLRFACEEKSWKSSLFREKACPVTVGPSSFIARYLPLLLTYVMMNTMASSTRWSQSCSSRGQLIWALELRHVRDEWAWRGHIGALFVFVSLLFSSFTFCSYFGEKESLPSAVVGRWTLISRDIGILSCLFVKQIILFLVCVITISKRSYYFFSFVPPFFFASYKLLCFNTSSLQKRFERTQALAVAVPQ